MSVPPFLWGFSKDRTTTPTPWSNVGNQDSDKTYESLGQYFEQREQVHQMYAVLIYTMNQKNEGDEFLKQLQLFCQDLIDLLSVEEFQLLVNMLAAEEQHLSTELTVDHLLLSKIRTTTHLLLDLNDRFEKFYSKGLHLSSIPKDVRRAGDPLMERSDLVDKFIGEYYGVTNRPPHASFTGTTLRPANLQSTSEEQPHEDNPSGRHRVGRC